tara:strand:- start:1500 stop:2717 length:1218 start_codon:yes stop_codon:yes gene_type:complete
MSEYIRDYPLYPHEVSNEFLSNCFGAEVTAFELDTSMTAGGVLADAFRVFNIQYRENQSLPKSCFVKCTKEIPEVVELCLATQVYAKEVYFYSTLIKKVKDVIRVPECYGIFKDDADKECKEFCLVLEDFDQESWMPFDQFENPMNFEDTAMLMKDLGSFHAACWNQPITGEPGLGPYKAHWQSLNDSFWEEEETAWDKVLPKWKDVYGEELLSLVTPEVQETILKINEIYNSENGKKIQEELLSEMQKRPRTITHGDARGNNIFKSTDNKTIGIIDWQMWAAGPASNEFSQLWFNSYSLESGMILKLKELTQVYYQSLIHNNSAIEDEYPFDMLLADTKLIFINMWIQYVGFTLGSIDGYKDPEQEQSKANWREMMKRNMETVHYSGCLNEFESFINQKELGDG